ncbi:hypothetical protein ACOJUR_15815 [Alicyclobacillus tolerans]|uniref:hypothetical protein n=1 Tax=Alicyclobacillus tolerans TaxID=90970 RepID=UPI003B7639DC
MKKSIVGITAALATLSTLSLWATPSAMADTYARANTEIALNNSSVMNAVHLIANDPWAGDSTSWLPVYYLDEAMQKLGFQASWNGDSYIWSLTVPNTYRLAPDVSNPPANQSLNSGRLAIALNGTIVEYAPRLVAPDPYSGVETTYVPIYYIMQVMKRVGITATWNGTMWNMTTPSGTGSSPTVNSNVVTQQSMADQMWAMFDAKTWDVYTHPTMSEAGVTPSATAPVTAGDVANYLSDWASHAIGYEAQGYGETAPSFHWFSIQYTASTNPFDWGEINGLYDNTGVTSANQTLTPSQAQTVLSNLQWWLNGYKVLPDGAYELHMPLTCYYVAYADEVNAQSPYTLADYEAVLTEDAKFYDEVTLQKSGNDWLLTLPNTEGSPTNVAWDVNYGNWAYGYQGGPNGAGDYGGKTFSVHFQPGVGFSIGLNSLDENAFGDTTGIPASKTTLMPLYVLDTLGMQSASDLPSGLSI